MKKKKRKKPGQPTKYKKIYCASIVRYFDIEPHIEKDITITKSDGTQIDKTEIEPVDLPFLSNWCASIGICQETMCLWAKVHPEFSEALKRAKELQIQIVITNGLRGLYSQPFAIFTMKNISTWRDSQQIEHSGEIKETVTGEITIADKTLKALGEAIVKAKAGHSQK